MYLLDSDTCITLLRGKAYTSHLLRQHLADGCAVSTVTVHEIAAGIGLAREREKEARRVKELLEILSVIDFDWRAAEESAKLKVIFQRSGRGIGPYDLLIAGHALSQHLTLVSHNTKHFSRVPDLKLVDWMQN